MKIVTVIGARPQFIKAAALNKAIALQPDIEEIIVHTGQHFDENMSAIFFNEMKIPAPKYQLAVNGLTHGAMTGRMLEGVEEILIKEKPDFLLVYGDTNSTLAGALAAKKLNIKVVHVEAGLRSFNLQMPEEINRILTDRISDFLFCPTDTAIQNLKNEGFENFNCKIINTGDIMYDSMLLFSEFAEKKAQIKNQLTTSNFALCTIHRAENTDNFENLKSIFEALNKIAENQTIVLPLHPRTKQKIQELKLNQNIMITEPLGYFDMLYLLKKCTIVLTDSGGLQKEAYFNHKFCITLRNETEWVELVEQNCNILVGSNTTKIIEAFNSKNTQIVNHQKPLYGNGKAAEKILLSLKN